MKFHLTIHVLRGKFAGQWVSIDFDAASNAKAYEFSREVQKLKTWDADPVEFGGYTLQRKFGPFVWLTFLSVADTGKMLYDRNGKVHKEIFATYDKTGEPK